MKINRKKITNFVVSLFIVVSAGAMMLAMAVPQTVAAADGDACNGGFLGFPAWYRGLTEDAPSCAIKSPGNDIPGFIWHIALNVVEMVMVAIAYVTSFYILYGGLLFMTSQGKPDVATKARMTILNAVIGLIISMASVAIIRFVVTRI